MGWGPVPHRDDPGRQRWLRAHAVNVRRWLADLQAAGIISYTGETDNLGMDWRTLITLHHAPRRRPSSCRPHSSGCQPGRAAVAPQRAAGASASIGRAVAGAWRRSVAAHSGHAR